MTNESSHMKRINKSKLTSLDGLKVGNMVTCNWQKPTEHALTVVEVHDEYVVFETSKGESLFVTPQTLQHYDISAPEGSPQVR